MRTRPTRVAVVGLGLIGGSLARALSARRHHVIGVDTPLACRRALSSCAIHEIAPTLEAAAAAADLVVLAAPPATNLRLLRRLARVARRDLVVTDVSSVKGPICREARRLGFRNFVGGHPMAGSEGSGFRASSGDLFRGKPWILTPEGSPRAVVARARAVAVAVGARPSTLRAAEHDRVVAFLSHLPQVVAWALASAARSDRATARRLALAGPGFRDMTRLSASPRGLWREILSQNRREVGRALAAFRRALRGAEPPKRP